MEALLHEVAHYVALTVEGIAILTIAVGTVEAIFSIFRVLSTRAATGIEKRAVWLNFAQWLVAALTFQLAADIVNTSFSPSWDEIGRLGVVAVIRTFLSFFLDREVENTRRLQHVVSSAEASRQPEERAE
jgi:uncharacterized membrane protein